MPTHHRYQLPVEQTGWRFQGQSEIDFSWEYDAPRERLLNLYDKAKRGQWDQATRIDWSTDLDPENPMQLDDRMISINGTEMWSKLTAKEKARTLLRESGVAAVAGTAFFHEGRVENLMRFCFAKRDNELQRACDMLRSAL